MGHSFQVILLLLNHDKKNFIHLKFKHHGDLDHLNLN